MTIEMPDIRIKKFSELSLEELYAILKVRAEVFVVEQNCPYQDLDGNDDKSIHVFAMEGNDCVGCLRVFMREDFDTPTAGSEGMPPTDFGDRKVAQVGRVVTALSHRGTGLGHLLMTHAIDVAKTMLPSDILYLEAQTYAIGFYQKSGFQVSSTEFLEDGIPHVQMTREF